ncbi:MAG TPA: hypothetical protein VMY99_02075 [Nevskiaceae bacterium]|nr:hypothetical protein [Nevskiaceae bacterium]
MSGAEACPRDPLDSLNSSQREEFVRTFPHYMHPMLRDDLVDDMHLRTLDQLKRWSEIDAPESVPVAFRTNLTLQNYSHEVAKQAEGRLPTAQDALTVLGHMMIYCGVHPVGSKSHSWVHLGRELPERESFPYATLQLMDERRVPMRAAPPSYQEHDQLRTPFELVGHSRGVEVVFRQGNVVLPIAYTDKTLPPSSARTVAYVREKRDPQDPHPLSIRANPLLGCGERCTFCHRQYEQLGNLALGALEKAPLFRMDPNDITRYAFYKFNNLSLDKLEEFGLVTGSFTNFNDLYTYVEELSLSLIEHSGGAFNPMQNEHQSIPVLTHLATEKHKWRR